MVAVKAATAFESPDEVRRWAL